MKKLKLAYEWIGPKGPISNNDYPNLYDLRRQYNMDDDYNYPARTANLTDLLTDVYDTEITPLSGIKDDDFFLYEINLDYKHMYSFESFYSGATNERIKQLLLYGKGYYAFNACLEGWCGDHFFHTMYTVMLRNGINPNRVIYFTGAVNGQQLHDQFIVKHHRAHHESMNIVTCNHYNTLPKQRISNKKSRSKKFICLNRRWKPHRLLLYVFLHKNNLLEHFYFSMPQDNLTSPGQNFHTTTLDLAKKYRVDIDIDDISAAFNSLPLVLDDSDFEKINYWDNKELSSYHDDSYISISTETFFEEKEVFPTEKVFRPMSFGQPFIVLSSAGYLEGLKAMGYKTFSGVLDESYDSMENNSDRLRMLLELIKDMCSWPESRFEEIIENTKAQCEHNHQIIGSGSIKNITREQLGKFYDNS